MLAFGDGDMWDIVLEGIALASSPGNYGRAKCGVALKADGVVLSGIHFICRAIGGPGSQRL